MVWLYPPAMQQAASVGLSEKPVKGIHHSSGGPPPPLPQHQARVNVFRTWVALTPSLELHSKSSIRFLQQSWNSWGAYDRPLFEKPREFHWDFSSSDLYLLLPSSFILNSGIKPIVWSWQIGWHFCGPLKLCSLSNSENWVTFKFNVVKLRPWICTLHIWVVAFLCKPCSMSLCRSVERFLAFCFPMVGF